MTELKSFISFGMLLKSFRTIKIKRLSCSLSSDFGKHLFLPTSPRVVDSFKSLKIIFKKHWRGSL